MKYIIVLFYIFSGITFLMPNANAYIIDLDGIANATLPEKIFSTSYLNISGHDDEIKYTYSGDNLLWSTYPEIQTDLSDGWIGEISSGIDLELGVGEEYKIRSGGDVFNSPNDTIYISLFLSAGTYNITLADNSILYNLGGKDEYYNAYVQIFGAVDNSFGGWELANSSYDLVFDNYRDEITTLYLSEYSELNFYINDWNSLDNFGSVRLDIQPASIPEPATLLLLSSGMFALAVKRGYRRKGR